MLMSYSKRTTIVRQAAVPHRRLAGPKALNAFPRMREERHILWVPKTVTSDLAV